MTMPDSESRLPSADSTASLIDRICDDFEATWRSGAQPAIQDFLGRAPGPLRDKLFEELLLSDLECRAAAGREIAHDQLLAQFPDRSEVVQRIVSQFSSQDHQYETPFHRPPPGNTAEAPNATVPEETVPEQARQCGKYQLLEEVARGGMGVVYKAYDTKLQRTVALKMILDRNLASREAVQRFRSEAEAAAGLNHSGIVPVFDVGIHEDLNYYVMGFVEGPTLAEELKRREYSPQQAAEIVIGLAHAVAHAHAHGIVHRDLKPENILLGEDGQFQITDFGLAKRTDEPSDLTRAGQVLGTPGYMAPEQAAGDVDKAGPTVDVYALGAILYHLLTGRPPFRTGLDAMLCVLEQDPVPPRALNRQIARDLNVICMKCLSKDPHHRYATAQQVADDLKRYLGGELIQARPASLRRRLHRWARHRPRLAAVWLTMAAYYSYHLAMFVTGNPGSLGFFHWIATGTVAVVCVYAWAYQRLLLKLRAKTWIRFLWVTTDVVAFTLFLTLATDGPQSPLTVIYPCLVAAAALSFDRYMVWLITGIALLSYTIVVTTHPWFHPQLPPMDSREAIPMIISMAAIGLIQYFVLRCLHAQRGVIPGG